MPFDKKIMICGGGIIGCSTAYHLATEHGVKCTIVERLGIASCASGRSGGFLARDWCDQNETGALAHRSFEMHAAFGERWPHIDYRRLTTLSVSAREGRHKERRGDEDLPKWVDSKAVGRSEEIGSTESTAQVTPFKLTNALLDAAKEKVGTDVIIGCVDGVKTNDEGSVRAVVVDGRDIACDVVVIALGPWSYQAARWFPSLARIGGRRAHSIILRTDADISPHAIFTDFTFSSGEGVHPEIYPRPDGTVFLCGMSDETPLPPDPAKVPVTEAVCKKLQKVAATYSSHLANAKVETTQACYLPTTSDGNPVIGKISDGAYIASGHSCWGILNSPATGLAMADLIVTGKSDRVDISAFSPQRFQKK